MEFIKIFLKLFRIFLKISYISEKSSSRTPVFNCSPIEHQSSFQENPRTLKNSKLNKFQRKSAVFRWAPFIAEAQFLEINLRFFSRKNIFESD